MCVCVYMICIYIFVDINNILFKLDIVNMNLFSMALDGFKNTRNHKAGHQGDLSRNPQSGISHGSTSDQCRSVQGWKMGRNILRMVC